MDEVRELDRILNEEDGNVVADDVPVAALRIQLHGKPADVAREVERALAADDRRETHERRRHLAATLEQVRARDVGKRIVSFEKPVRAEAARVHDAFGYSFVIEMKKLFAKVKVFEQGGAVGPEPQRVLVVRHGRAMLRRQLVLVDCGADESRRPSPSSTT